ncbi:universal stress family protein [Mycobacterium kansasii 732]|nr:universal stress family protein [Mycobacterium kansasii 732]
MVPHPMLSAEYEALANGPILVGWDGSSGAATALAAAKRLCPRRDVLLIAVGDGPAPGPPVDPSGAVAADVLRLTVNRGHGLRARAVSEALVAAADDHNAALVVVGSRGRSGARDVVLGSVAVGTVHHSHRPVMVVPGGWEVVSGS